MPDTAIAGSREDDTEAATPKRRQRRPRFSARKTGIVLIAAGLVLAVVGGAAYISASSARTEIGVIRAEREALEDDLAELTDATLASALRATDIDAFSAQILDELARSRTAREQVETAFGDAVSALDRRQSSQAKEIVEGDGAGAVEAERTAYEQLAATIKSLDDRLEDSSESDTKPSPDESSGE